MRNAEISRKTAETEISLWLELDGSGNSSIDTGVGFMDHMLTLLAKHARFDLVVKCVGDTYVDDHHSVEDIGIALGKAFADALGEKRGINRYADTTLAMDEALVLTSLDISGRTYLGYELNIPTQKVGTFDTELVEEFLMAFVRTAQVTLHVMGLRGKNSHHVIECLFKSLARTLRHAVAIDRAFADDIPSTKGVLDDGIVDEEIPGLEDDLMDAYDELGELDYEEPEEEPEPVEEAVEAEEEPEPVEEAPEAVEEPKEEPAPPISEPQTVEELLEQLEEVEESEEEEPEPVVEPEPEPRFGLAPEEEYDEIEAERAADNAKALYSFTMHGIKPVEDITYEPYDEDLIFDNAESFYDEYDDPSVDDVDRLAEQMARDNLSAQRRSGSTGLGDDAYGVGIARGYTGMDLPVRDVEEELKKGRR